MNQQRPHAARARAIPEDVVIEAEVMANKARVQVSSLRGKYPLFPRISGRETRLPPLWRPRYIMGCVGIGQPGVLYP